VKRLRVLASAYACNPLSSLQLHPGEDIAGWRLVEQISRFHDVWVISHSYNRAGVEKGLKEKNLPHVKFYFYHLPSWLRFLSRIEFGKRIYYYLWQLGAWKLAENLNRKVHFDLAHHLTFGNDWIPSFIGALLPIPFVLGPVGGGQKTPRGLRKEYSLYGRFAESARNIAQWFGRRDYFRRLGLEKARAILVCNQETEAMIPNRLKGKIFLFPVNGILEEDIRFDIDPPPDHGIFRVLTAGRMHRLKGFALAIKSFSLFLKKYPGSEFLLIGDGPEGRRLRKLVHDLSLEDKVKIIPWLPRNELLKTMFSSHVVVFPSFRDGGGAVVVEAMAAGRPVVCLDSGGPGFHVQPEWGIKISPNSSEAVIKEMADALEKLFLDKALRKSLGLQAKQRVEEFYLWDRLGERLQGIYQFALKSGSKYPDLPIEH